MTAHKFSTEQIAHLGFAQANIARMAGNSLSLKGGCVALVTGLLAVFVATKELKCSHLIIAVFPILMLGILDAKYLKLEKQFRKLYQAIIDSEIEPFNMDPNSYSNEVPSLFKIFISWSISGFYIPVALVVLLFPVFL